jgi:hypothetical protein
VPLLLHRMLVPGHRMELVQEHRMELVQEHQRDWRASQHRIRLRIRPLEKKCERGTYKQTLRTGAEAAPNGVGLPNVEAAGVPNVEAEGVPKAAGAGAPNAVRREPERNVKHMRTDQLDAVSSPGAPNPGLPNIFRRHSRTLDSLRQLKNLSRTASKTEKKKEPVVAYCLFPACCTPGPKGRAAGASRLASRGPRTRARARGTHPACRRHRHVLSIVY